MKIKSTAQKPVESGKGRKKAPATSRRKQRGEGSSKSIPEDIMEPKSWDLEFMAKVQPIFVDMVDIQK